MVIARTLHAALLAALVLALWTLARPAQASAASGSAGAPLCDDRGATWLAPPPALDDSGETIMRSRVSAPGEGSLRRLRAVLAATNGRLSTPLAHAAALLGCSPPWPERGLLGRRAGPDARPLAPPDGVRSRVDRPPRG